MFTISDSPAERVAELVESLPQYVKIGPYQFRLEMWTAQQAMGARRYGECSTVEQRISIQRDHVCPVRLLDTVLHEINHALFWLCNLGDDDKEEHIVGHLATAQVQLFADNPWLHTFIQRALI